MKWLHNAHSTFAHLSAGLALVGAARVKAGVAVLAELQWPPGARHTILLLRRLQLARLLLELLQGAAIELGPHTHAAGAVLLRPAGLRARLPPPQVGGVEGGDDQVVRRPEPPPAGVADDGRKPEQTGGNVWGRYLESRVVKSDRMCSLISLASPMPMSHSWFLLPSSLPHTKQTRNRHCSWVSRL